MVTMQNDRMQQLEKLKQKLQTFRQSPLYTFRKKNNYHFVLGEGTPLASVVFVGEAPGKKEAETGKPFAGASGKMLNSLLSSINLKREDVYITNIVNDQTISSIDENE